MREKNNTKIVFGAIVAFLALIVVIVIGILIKSATKPKDLEGLMKGMHASVTEATPQKGPISLGIHHYMMSYRKSTNILSQ